MTLFFTFFYDSISSIFSRLSECIVEFYGFRISLFTIFVSFIVVSIVVSFIRKVVLK